MQKEDLIVFMHTETWPLWNWYSRAYFVLLQTKTNKQQQQILKETLGTFLKFTIKEGNQIYFSAGPHWEHKFSTYSEGRNAEVFKEQKENWIIHCKTAVISGYLC